MGHINQQILARDYWIPAAALWIIICISYDPVTGYYKIYIIIFVSIIDMTS